MTNNQIPEPHNFDLTVKKNHLFKMLLMILIVVAAVWLVWDKWYKDYRAVKTKQNTVYLIESNKSQDTTFLKAFQFEDKLVKEDCWVSLVRTDRSGRPSTTHYHCFNTDNIIISTHYTPERTFEETQLDVQKHLLIEKSAYIRLGKERFCQFTPSSQLCQPTAKT